MVNEHALTVSLEEFGLSKYEAQAYVTLHIKGNQFLQVSLPIIQTFQEQRYILHY